MIRQMVTVLVTTSLALAVGLRPAAQGPRQPAIAELVQPSGARILSRGGYGFTGRGGPDQSGPLMGAHYRLSGAGPVPDVLDSNISQLTALGWKQTLRQVDQALGFARFSVGLADDPAVGILWVVPFETSGQTVVNVHLVRSKAPWSSRGGRSGGGGANAQVPPSFRGPVSFNILTGPFTFPASVTWLEERGGGGGGDIWHSDLRVETSAKTVDLMAGIEKQVGMAGWTVDVRGGDAMQTVLRRSATGDRRSEVWTFTTMPGVPEVDALLYSICDDQRTPVIKPGERPVRPDYSAGHRCGERK